MAYVVIVAGPHRGEVKPVTQDFCLISRNGVGGDQLNLGNDEFVSRVDSKNTRNGHALMQKIDDVWRLTDCGSRNNTWVILNGAFNPLAARAFVRMEKAFLFGCGQSGLLFLDVDEEPSAALIKDLCGTSTMNSAHPSDAPSPTRMLAGTDTNPAPLSEAAASLARWQQVTSSLCRHGLEHLL